MQTNKQDSTLTNYPYKANETTLLVSRPPIFVFSCGWAIIIHYSLFSILSFGGVVDVLELIGTAQIINNMEAWLAFQGNNEGSCSRFKQTRAGTRN